MKKLKNGWVEGTVQEFLDLSDADMEYIETKRALSTAFRRLRQKRHLTQIQTAVRLKTSQARVCKMEHGDNTVSLDLLVQSMYRLGAKRRELAKAL